MALQPYLRLARADRPIGTWLLLFPCLWSLLLAQIASGQTIPNIYLILLFAIGAFVMRGSGCAYNDYVDRDFDAKVERTQSRPIPSGQVTPNAALAFAIFLALIGLLVLLQFNTFTIGLAAASLVLIAIYPFMKRFTYWPQLVLGLVFNWGALVGWASITATIDLAPVLLYIGAVNWTLGYDTIYAHQDKDDDVTVGLKSTAILLGDKTKPWLAVFYAAALAFWLATAILCGAILFTFLALSLIAVQFTWQIITLETDDPNNCLKRFKSNRDVGALFFVGLLADMILIWLVGVGN